MLYMYVFVDSAALQVNACLCSWRDDVNVHVSYTEAQWPLV